MGNSFQFIDIIFFAMIAIFLILRLRGALGKRDGNDGSSFLDSFKQDRDDIKSERDSDTNNIIKPSESFSENSDLLDIGLKDNLSNLDGMKSQKEGNTEINESISQIQTFDPNFNEEDFLVGARVAFEMILKSFASADVDELKKLVSNEVYGNFAKAIQDREKVGHIMEDTLVGIMKSEMVEAYMDNNDAHVTIKFESEQVNAIRDKDNVVVEGDANVVLKVTDFWTFARHTESLDPNWLLVATRSLE